MNSRLFENLPLMALVLPLMLLCLAERVAALTIVRDGAPQATIVVAKASLNPPKEDAVAGKVAVAAQDLQAYIQKMSGARLPIVSDEGKSGAINIIRP